MLQNALERAPGLRVEQLLVPRQQLLCLLHLLNASNHFSASELATYQLAITCVSLEAALVLEGRQEQTFNHGTLGTAITWLRSPRSTVARSLEGRPAPRSMPLFSRPACTVTAPLRPAKATAQHC